MRKLLLKINAAGLALALYAALTASVHAAVVTDGSLGTATTLTGPNYDINSSLGQTRGTNLFHSFSQFNLSSTESATFSGPGSITNIISRITGGIPSNIDGTITSSISGANLYLMNPSGIVFGPSASLNVTGSFHATTADYVQLGASGRFEATTGGGTNLTSDPPSAFGFLNPNPAAISLDGSLLTVPEGKDISIVSGGISLSNANLWAFGGGVNLISVDSAGEVLYDGNSFNPVGFSSLGPVSITENRDPSLQPVYDTYMPGIPIDMLWLRTANLDASGNGGGKIFIRGGSFYLSGGTIYNDTYGSVAPQSVDIGISNDVTISRSSITGNAMAGTAAGAPISISGYSVHVTDSVINTDSMTGTIGSDVTLTATDQINIRGASVVSTDANSSGSQAGRIALAAPDISIGTGSRVSSSAPVLGAAGAGSITVDASRSLTVGGQLRSDTFDGTSGAVTIRTGELDIFGNGLISSALVSNPAATPRSAGDIVINASDINLADSASIQSNVLFSNSGTGGNIFINSNNMYLINSSSISSSNDSVSGSGGNILINNSWIVSLLNSEVTTSATKISGSGDGGNVTINTGYLALNASRITAQASYGSGGNLLLTMSKMFVPSADSLLSASSRYGTQGTVVVNAPSVDVAGAIAAPRLDFVNLDAFSPKRCVAVDESDSSTFRLIGSEGLPAHPEASFPAR